MIASKKKRNTHEKTELPYWTTLLDYSTYAKTNVAAHARTRVCVYTPTCTVSIYNFRTNNKHIPISPHTATHRSSSPSFERCHRACRICRPLACLAGSYARAENDCKLPSRLFSSRRRLRRRRWRRFIGGPRPVARDGVGKGAAKNFLVQLSEFTCQDYWPGKGGDKRRDDDNGYDTSLEINPFKDEKDVGLTL